MTDEMLAKMWQSNADFHQRFLGRPANLMESLYAFDEEQRELRHASLQRTEQETAIEAADVLYTVIGVLRSRGISFEDFLMACQSVIAKNDAKTLETHHLRADGKIAKK